MTCAGRQASRAAQQIAATDPVCYRAFVRRGVHDATGRLRRSQNSPNASSLSKISVDRPGGKHSRPPAVGGIEWPQGSGHRGKRLSSGSGDFAASSRARQATVGGRGPRDVPQPQRSGPVTTGKAFPRHRPDRQRRGRRPLRVVPPDYRDRPGYRGQAGESPGRRRGSLTRLVTTLQGRSGRQKPSSWTPGLRARVRRADRGPASITRLTHFPPPATALPAPCPR
jgi:hypothetical protein